MTSLLPIPAHLPAWQAGHLAWMLIEGMTPRYAVPEGTKPKWADLRNADLREANLTEADLTGACLREADLTWADLSGAYLGGADLSLTYLREADLVGADLIYADLRRANLSGADLTGADLTSADLTRAVLRGVDLNGATGIASIGPVVRHGSILYAVDHDDGPMVHAGCLWGSVGDIIARIEADYLYDPAARDRYVAAVRTVAALVTP